MRVRCWFVWLSGVPTEGQCHTKESADRNPSIHSSKGNNPEHFLAALRGRRIRNAPSDYEANKRPSH